METFGIRSLWIASVLLVYSQPVRSQFPLCYDRPLWLEINTDHYYRIDNANEFGYYHTTALSDCWTYCRDTRNTTYFGIRRRSKLEDNGDITSQSRVQCYCGDSLTNQTTITMVGADRCSLLCEINSRCGGSVYAEMSAYSVCPPGKYGPSCGLDCRRDCDGGECYPDSGHCCPAGRYGTDCSQNCANDNCKDGPCDSENGDCLTGCQSGWTGDRCDCPENCRDLSCDSESGDCLTGCKGDQWFGAECRNPCSIDDGHCEGGVCDQEDGVCSDGCTLGYYGHTCQLSCPDNCEGGVCDQLGRCVIGCVIGSYGNSCQHVCPAVCDGVCIQNCASVCDNLSGQCPRCQPGWTGDQCELSCPDNCADSVCSKEGGLCTGGCDPGWTGTTCDEKGQSLSTWVYAVIAVLAVVIVVGLVVTLVLCLRKKKTRQEGPSDQHTTDSTQLERVAGSHDNTEDTETYETIDIRP